MFLTQSQIPAHACDFDEIISGVNSSLLIIGLIVLKMYYGICWLSILSLTL